MYVLYIIIICRRSRDHWHCHTHTRYLFRALHRSLLSVRNLLCILSVSFTVFFFFFSLPPVDDLMTWLTRSVSRSHYIYYKYIRTHYTYIMYAYKLVQDVSLRPFVLINDFTFKWCLRN